MSYHHQEKSYPQWLSWTQWGSLVTICVGLFVWSYAQTLNVNSRVDAQNARSDQLYSIIIELLKEKK